MDVATVLAELGGVATRADLLVRVGRRDVDRARVRGEIVPVARGRYVLPTLVEAPTIAHALTGTLSFRSAALLHGWAVKQPPPRPDVTIPRNRRLSAARAATATVHRACLGPDDVVEVAGCRVTSTDRTLADCLRGLPPDEALAVVDSALRGGVTPGRLRRVATAVSGPGRPQARRVAARADGRAANPFESVLRAIALDVPGLKVEPQVDLWSGAVFLGRPDLVDRELGIVLEADSFAWHGDRAALAHDCRRYDEMTAAGWLVLRFAYEQVMGEPAWIHRILVACTAERTVLRSRAG